MSAALPIGAFGAVTVALAVGEVDPSTVVPGEGGSGEPTATPTATATPTG